MSAPKRAKIIASNENVGIDDFIQFASHESEESEEEAEENIMEDDQDWVDGTADAAAGRPDIDTARAVPIDWSCSDLTLEFEIPKGRGMILRRQSLLPTSWALARGARVAFQGRQVWQVKILRLPKGIASPSLLFGVLVQWPGCRPMPSPEEDVLVQPCLVLLADTGEQVFSSNLSPKLLRGPLFSTALQEGDCIDVIADLSRRRLQFRKGDETVEAKPLPIRRDTAGRGSRVTNRLRETAYCPFVALQVGVEVELLDTCPPWRRGVSPVPEAIILAGPPGSGKSAWAAEYAKAKGHVHVLGAEWLHHRNMFLEDEHEVSNAEIDQTTDHLGDAGRVALAQRIIEAFSVLEGGCDDDPLNENNLTMNRRTQVHALHFDGYGSHDLARAADTSQAQMAQVLPELLQRAATRHVSVIADGCHLQASFRAELRAALLRFPGRVRWVVMIPKTLEELLNRQSQTKTHNQDAQWSGSTLPGAEGDGNFTLHDVEFAEGRDHEVFHQWLMRICAVPKASAKPVKGSKASDMQGFFTNFGDSNRYLSTEGLRRY